ncbi:MAG: hypothetical protein ACE5FN_11290 [Leptospirillia bacterium]
MPVSGSTHQDGKPPIRVLHQLARCGGTLIARCLASMEGVYLLSEIHPYTLRIFNPMSQAVRWYDLFTREDLKPLRDVPLNFADAIAIIAGKVAKRGGYLIVRDWTHIDFQGIPFIPKPSYRLTTAELLSDKFQVINSATVRHPLDQFVSVNKLEGMEGLFEVEPYFHGYRRFAEMCPEIGFVRYEDFTRAPDRVLKTACEQLNIPFDPGYRERWMHYANITGDKTGTHLTEITPQPRRKVEPELEARITACPDYRRILELLGYTH